jgi:N-acetylmuramate 1-kinase
MEIINQFLSQHFGRNGFEVFQLAGDASARKYFRIAFEEQTYVLMSWEPFDQAQYPFLSVQKYFAAIGVRVPKVLKVADTLGLILLEDLGDLTLERKFWENQNHDSALPFYEQSIDEILKIHFSVSPTAAECSAHKIQFDTAKFNWEFNYTKEHLFSGLAKVEWSKAKTETYDQFAMSISQRLDSLPKWICHRDYHSRNLMIKLNKVYVIDFQDARRGPIQYDLVSLLRDSYVNLSEELVDSLLHSFWNQAKKHMNADTSLELFMRDFEVQTLQRCLKACGSFASFWNQRQDQRYLKYINPTLKRVEKTIQSFPEYKNFYSLMTDAGLFQATFEK